MQREREKRRRIEKSGKLFFLFFFENFSVPPPFKLSLFSSTSSSRTVTKSSARAFPQNSKKNKSIVGPGPTTKPLRDVPFELAHVSCRQRAEPFLDPLPLLPPLPLRARVLGRRQEHHRR